MSFKKTVVLTMWFIFDPAASTIPRTFSRTRSVCLRISASVISPVFGSSATCPETNKKPFARMACEYGPIGFAPRSVSTTSLIVNSPLETRQPTRTESWLQKDCNGERLEEKAARRESLVVVAQRSSLSDKQMPAGAVRIVPTRAKHLFENNYRERRPCTRVKPVPE